MSGPQSCGREVTAGIGTPALTWLSSQEATRLRLITTGVCPHSLPVLVLLQEAGAHLCRAGGQSSRTRDRASHLATETELTPEGGRVSTEATWVLHALVKPPEINPPGARLNLTKLVQVTKRPLASCNCKVWEDTAGF